MPFATSYYHTPSGYVKENTKNRPRRVGFAICSPQPKQPNCGLCFIAPRFSIVKSESTTNTIIIYGGCQVPFSSLYLTFPPTFSCIHTNHNNLAALRYLAKLPKSKARPIALSAAIIHQQALYCTQLAWPTRTLAPV